MPEARSTPVRLQHRERRLAIVAGLVIAGWGFVSWLAQPLWDHLRDVRDRIDTQTEKLNALSRLLDTAPEVEQDYQRVAGYLVDEPGDQAQSRLLMDLEALGRSAGVQPNLKPRPIRQDERVSRLEVEVEVEGSQEAILGFLDRVMTLPKLISVERLRISGAPAQARQLRANLVLSQISPKR